MRSSQPKSRGLVCERARFAAPMRQGKTIRACRHVAYFRERLRLRLKSYWLTRPTFGLISTSLRAANGLDVLIVPFLSRASATTTIVLNPKGGP